MNGVEFAWDAAENTACFARRIAVSPETLRNGEQGKRGPTGAACALLRVLDKAPETALRVLT